MPSTQEILDAARKLGEQVAQHDAAKRVEAAIKALDADVDAQRAMTDLNRHIQAVAEKERGGKPIEVEDKRKLDKLQQAVVTNATLRDFQVAQMEYVDLLRKIDEAITGPAPDAPGSTPAPPGAAGPGPAGGSPLSM